VASVPWGHPISPPSAQAAGALIRHHASGAALDPHLGDQILLPLCLAAAPSRLSVEAVTPHLETNAWVIERFGMARIAIEQHGAAIGQVTITPS
jgi:RNA 3'-terminal phosphate cyclase (ATP)